MQGTMITIGIIYLLICLLIGIWATRKTKSTSEFFIAGQNLGMFVMAIAAFSSVQSGFGMVGGTASTFNGGLGFVRINCKYKTLCLFFFLNLRLPPSFSRGDMAGI